LFEERFGVFCGFRAENAERSDLSEAIDFANFDSAAAVERHQIIGVGNYLD
jgi:hypothetical protein